jgi:hypothetical protein
MLGGLLAAAVALVLLNLGPFGPTERDKRHHYLWVGAGLLVAGACPERWVGLSLAVIVLSALLKPPIAHSTLSLPPIVAWGGVYDLLSVALPRPGWHLAMAAAVAVCCLGIVLSTTLRVMIITRGIDPFNVEVPLKIPFTRLAYVYHTQSPNLCAPLDNPFFAGPAFAWLLPWVAGMTLHAQGYHVIPWAFLGLILLWGMWLTGSRGAWVAALVSAGVYVAVLMAPAAPGVLVAALGGAGAVAVVAWMGPTGRQRDACLRQSFLRWQKFPWIVRWTGTGPWGWWFWMADGRPQQGLVPTEEAIRLREYATPGQTIRHLHNDWAQAVFEHGPLILVPTLGYLATTLWRLGHSPDPWAPAMAAGVAGIAVTCLWAHPFRMADTSLLILLWLVGAGQVR